MKKTNGKMTLKEAGKRLYWKQVEMLESGNCQRIADCLCIPDINFWIREIEKFLDGKKSLIQEK